MEAILQLGVVHQNLLSRILQRVLPLLVNDNHGPPPFGQLVAFTTVLSFISVIKHRFQYTYLLLYVGHMILFSGSLLLQRIK